MGSSPDGFITMGICMPKISPLLILLHHISGYMMYMLHHYYVYVFTTAPPQITVGLFLFERKYLEILSKKFCVILVRFNQYALISNLLCTENVTFTPKNETGFCKGGGDKPAIFSANIQHLRDSALLPSMTHWYLTDHVS